MQNLINKYLQRMNKLLVKLTHHYLFNAMGHNYDASLTQEQSEQFHAQVPKLLFLRRRVRSDA